MFESIIDNKDFKRTFKVYDGPNCIAHVSYEIYQDLHLYFGKEGAKRELVEMLMHETQKRCNHFNCSVKPNSFIYVEGFYKVVESLFDFVGGRL